MTEAKLSELDNPLYSLAHLTLINCTPAELVYVAARAGYDAVSPRFITMNADHRKHQQAHIEPRGKQHRQKRYQRHRGTALNAGIAVTQHQ